jgi:predicted DNA-binding transcriptional regulator YafY
MPDRSGRLFEIIQILRAARAPISARVIAETLEVTKRTIYRDVVTLQARGVPIEGAAGVGYIMRPGYNLPPLMFTEDEIEAVTVGLSLLGRTGDFELKAAAVRALGKIEEVLPGGERSLEKTPLLVSQWTAIPSANVDYRLIREAIRKKQKLQLRYKDIETRESLRTVKPLALVYYIDAVVLASWCELREDFRHFRIDRITNCLPLDNFFQRESARLLSQWRERCQVLMP